MTHGTFAGWHTAAWRFWFILTYMRHSESVAKDQARKNGRRQRVLIGERHRQLGMS